MIIFKSGKCDRCSLPVKEQREFAVTVDMFDPQPKTYLKGELLAELRKWREQKMYCSAHHPPATLRR